MSTIAEEVARPERKQTLHLQILYNGIRKEVEINHDATVRNLLDRAIALFGNLPQPHALALWTEK